MKKIKRIKRGGIVEFEETPHTKEQVEHLTLTKITGILITGDSAMKRIEQLAPDDLQAQLDLSKKLLTGIRNTILEKEPA